MVVVDASVLVELLTHSPAAPAIRARLSAAPRPFRAPHLIEVEVANVLRRLVGTGKLPAHVGWGALQAFTLFPLRRYPHAPLFERVWALRANLSAYDAFYVALAEGLGATLLTRDARLAKAPGLRAPIEVL